MPISQDDAIVIMTVAAMVFTAIGNYIVLRVNESRMRRHAADSRELSELLEQARQTLPRKKGGKKPPAGATIEIEEPALMSRFRFWIVLLMTLLIYSALTVLHR